ncbi:MAG: enoyl-CoA hydratase/isomerase family protein [Betaproteobacteria bacterium]|nr:enoyl-CoA hydratase/isomerase family protein [Betaproteobacteria bacterium]
MNDTSTGSVTEQRLSPQIALIQISNPGKLNSFSVPMWHQLTQLMNQLGRADSGVRCIILGGADKQSFAAGSDITEFKSKRSNVEQARVYGKVVSNALYALEYCHVPMIAKINGICVGGGLAVASLCDYQVAGQSSKFGVPVNRLGLVMAHAEMRGVVRKCGPAFLKEVLFEGKIYKADQALAKGLITHLTADENVEIEVNQIAENIVKGAPLVARWHKKFIHRLLDPTPLSDAEIDEANACFATEDYRIGVDAFDQKKQPIFKGI